MEWSQIALLSVIACILAASVAGGLVTTWSLHRRAYRLELRVTDLEERHLTMTKRQAAAVRWEKPDKLLAEAEALKNAAGRRTVPDDPPWFREGI
jgi:hypothetical protein